LELGYKTKRSKHKSKLTTLINAQRPVDELLVYTGALWITFFGVLFQ